MRDPDHRGNRQNKTARSHWRTALSALVVAWTLGGSLSASAQPAEAAALPLDDLKPGMTGEVWTVFQGRQPEPFSVEVTGIVRNAIGPGKSLIVCKLTDPRVQNMGAVSGMSGSPLYIGGKLAGVLSYQLQRFETVRYAGFTPIADMMEVARLPIPSTVTPPPPLPFRPIEGKAESAAVGDFSPLTPVFTGSGIAPNVASILQPQFEALGLSVVALGGNLETDAAPAAPSPPPPLRPGDAVAVALAVGSITFSGTGTVSRVEGDRVLAFGHPMLNLGLAELPMVSVEIVAILPSQATSFKVANAGPVIGTINQDRLSAVYGELGRMPALIPVVVELPTRQQRRTLNFSVVKQPQITPVIVAAGVAQAVLGSNEAGLAQGFRLRTTVAYPSEAPVQASQLFAGPQGFAQGLGEFTRDLNLCLFNPYAKAFPSRIDFLVEPLELNPLAVLEQVQVSRTMAAPGDEVSVTLNWRRFQADRTREVVRIPISPEWAGKSLEVVVATGRLLDELTGRQRNPPAGQVRSFSDYLANLRAVRSNEGLYVAVLEETSLFIDQQAVTADLPGSLERIAHGSDDSRFQRCLALAPLWEQRVLENQLFNDRVRRPLRVAE
ncbi:MAG: SpoIVB peptidase S55 domain-containing protein [Opitutaceae bacterium]|nr:SpoIVB peptidase S55 domain-containing protein [Opitutaceae bacterium]